MARGDKYYITEHKTLEDQKKYKGKYSAIIERGINPLTNNRSRHTKRGFRTEKLAKDYAENWIKNNQHKLYEVDNPLFGDFMSNWFESIILKTDISANTIADYKLKINKYIIPRLGEYRIKDITPGIMQNFYNDLIDIPLVPATVNITMILAKKCFKYAKKMNQIDVVPCDIEKIPVKRTKEKVKVWTEEQLKYFVSQIEDTRLYLPVIIASLTGMRAGEICGLRYKNIDLDKGIIAVKEQTKNDKIIKKAVHTKILKTDASYRNITIPKFLVDILQDLKTKDSNFVVTDSKGGLLNPKNLSDTFTKKVYRYTLEPTDKRALKISNYKQLPKIKFHGLRSTHATMLLLKGENIKVISDRLGHSTINMTLNKYSFVLDEMRINTTSYLDDIF